MILLDTHALLWLTTEPERLSKRASAAIRRASRGGGIAVSAITFYEVGSLVRYGRFRIAGTIETFLAGACTNTSVIPISIRIAALANAFSADYPGDPCDRIIGATALAEGVALITKDERIRACRQLQTIW